MSSFSSSQKLPNDQEKQEKPRGLMRLINILKLPKGTRSAADCGIIFEFLRNTSPVANLDDDDVLQLCQCATHVNVRDESDIFQQDDTSDAFYIIIDGSILVTKRLKEGFVRLSPGDGFGQLGILKKLPRAATCTADGDTELVKVDAADYEKLFETKHERELQERVTFLSDIAVLRHMAPDELRLMAEVMVEQEFPPNKVVVREGDDANAMYFVLDGKASVVMTIPYKKIPRFVEITQIGPYDFFGELGLLNTAPRSASVIAHVPLTCLVLSKIDFGRFIAGTTLQAIKEFSRRYTPRAEITRLFCEKQKWAEYKKTLVADIVSHKQKLRTV